MIILLKGYSFGSSASSVLQDDYPQTIPEIDCYLVEQNELDPS